MTQWGGGCQSLQAITGPLADCCGSCHYDDEEGYDSGSDVELNGVTFDVCCTVARAFDKWECDTQAARSQVSITDSGGYQRSVPV